MRGLLFALAMIALSATALPGVAAAQAHGGVDVRDVVPATMEIVDVVVPDHDAGPVRLALAARNEARASLLVDVWVTPDETAARARYTHALEMLTGDVPDAPGLGDAGVADPGFAAFVRDNVAVAIRRVSGADDVDAFARSLDRAIAATPVGPIRASGALQLPSLDAMASGEHATIALPAWALGAELVAHGEARIRRTRDGWLLTRTGSGPARLEAHVIDRRLRGLSSSVSSP